MPHGIDIKICGLSTERTLEAAVAAGATHVGFVFYPRSPRAVTAARAAELARLVPPRVLRCGLFVDAADSEIGRTLDAVPLDVIQLHGDEPPEHCARVRDWTRRRVMKAVAIASDDDVRRAGRWDGAVDLLLFDAKPPRTTDALPGGNGVAFDWGLLAGRSWRTPWMLSGGLNPANVRDAIRQTQAPAVDVSSGVETSPGIKDEALIRDFIAAVRQVG